MTTNTIDLDYGDAEIIFLFKMGDNYFSAKLMLPKGGVMVKGCVTVQKREWNATPLDLQMTSQSLTHDITLSI
jgi:hypothetical protein